MSSDDRRVVLGESDEPYAMTRSSAAKNIQRW
jgi:hypothetical protein